MLSLPPLPLTRPELTAASGSVGELQQDASEQHGRQTSSLDASPTVALLAVLPANQ
jgi:hypothetical protein